MRPMYVANRDHTRGYAGNRLCGALKKLGTFPHSELNSRSRDIGRNELWTHVARISQSMNMALQEYFDGMGCMLLLPPLTTRLLSSPKRLYSKAGAYTSEALPMRLRWFETGKDMFLSQSAQMYMEIYATAPEVKGVYCIANSFRSEKAGGTHLPEFHIIEYEGRMTQKENKRFILNLIRAAVGRLVRKNFDDLSFFLFEDDIEYLKGINRRDFGTEITFEQALDILYRSTKDRKYEQFTAKNFGAWEEVKLTSELDDMAIVTEFPFSEGAFYQAKIKRGEAEVGDNADFIWPYFREIASSSHRARSFRELAEAIKRFNLPMEDYKHYLETRRSKNYVETSGFGLGWERLLQGLLKMPYIQSVTPFPRVDYAVRP